MKLRRAGLGWAAAVLAAGCSDVTQPAPLPAFTVSPATQWSGGTVQLRSSYFVGRSALPLVLAAAETAAVRRLDDSTIAATLPRGPSAPIALSVVHDGRTDTVATVQAVGYHGRRDLTPGLTGELSAADSGGHPVVFGNVAAGVTYKAPLGRIDLVTGVGQTLSGVWGPSDFQYGLSPSLPAGLFAVRDSTDSLRLATLLAAPPAVVATVPFVGTTYVRQASQLSSGLWLFTTSHTSTVRAESDSCCLPRFSFATESPWSLFPSPRGDRLTMTSSSPLGGIPVFDNATGDTAFTLPLRGTLGIAFSADGSRLFAVGGDYASPDTLLAVDATTGQLLAARVVLPAGFTGVAMAYSAGGGGRLLIAAADSRTLALLVYDAATLTLQGILDTPDGCGADPLVGNCFYGVVAVDDGRGVAHVAAPGDPGSPTAVWTFDLLP